MKLRFWNIFMDRMSYKLTLKLVMYILNLHNVQDLHEYIVV